MKRPPWVLLTICGVATFLLPAWPQNEPRAVTAYVAEDVELPALTQ